jgi:hypothetical protein
MFNISNMRIQENLHLYKTFNIWEEILRNFSKYEWVKDILNINLKLNHSLKIPLDKLTHKNIYSIRFIPFFYFNEKSSFIDIPSILLECWNIDELWNINYSTKDISIKAKFNVQNPWYFIEEVLMSYKYLSSLLKWFIIDIQFAENLDFNPLWEREEYYNKLGFHIFKDWIYNKDYINWKNTFYEIVFDTLNITNTIHSFDRSPFFSIKYPIYREMMLASVILLPKNNKNTNIWKVTWITYDGSFYKNIWVPLNRSLYFTLKFSCSLQNGNN